MSPSLPRRLWSLLATGLPFAIFKFGGGLAARDDVTAVLGYAVMGWGLVDLLLNVAWLVVPQRLPPCSACLVGRLLDRRAQRDLEALGLAVDTLLALAIVATMIWFERTATLPGPLPGVWKVAVIGGILGSGIERVWGWSRQHRTPAPRRG